jgi:AcrR family transcriptional regulator
MPKISATRKEERRSQVLKAAITCFAKNGFHQTTILDICAEAGLSAGAVYSYFDSKDAIIEALAERGRKFADTRSMSADRESAPLERLKVFLQEFERPGSAKVNQFDLRSWAEAIGNRQLREIYLGARADTIKQLADMLRPAAKEYALAPEALGELVLAVIVGSETRRAIQPAADVMPALNALFKLLEARTPGRR